MIIKNKHPLPQFDVLFDQIQGASIFSKNYLRLGYHQIIIKDENIHNEIFRTRHGYYEFVVFPFGLNNAPTTFMCFINSVLRHFLDKFSIIFINDILI